MKMTTKSLALSLLLLTSVPHMTYAGFPTQEEIAAQKAEKTKQKKELIASICVALAVPAVVIAAICGFNKWNQKKMNQVYIKCTNHSLDAMQEQLSGVPATDDELQKLIYSVKPRSIYCNLEKIDEIFAFEQRVSGYIQKLSKDETQKVQVGELENKSAPIFEKTQALRLKIAGLPETEKQRDLLKQKELLPPAPVTNTYVHQTMPRPAHVINSRVSPHGSYLTSYTY